MQFLDAMSQGWNISLFHYRNHGADYGRVLAGIQVPPRERRTFKESLRKLGYPYVEETDNPAARLFLAPSSFPRRAIREQPPRPLTREGSEEPNVDPLDHSDHPARAAAARRLRLLEAIAASGERCAAACDTRRRNT